MKNPKLVLLLLLFTLSLLLLPSHSYKRRGAEEEEESPEGELFECFLKCGKQRRPNEHELSQCEQRCVDRYEQTKRQERQEGGGDERSFAQTEEPRKVYDRCLSGCDEKQGSKSQEYQCRKTCQQQYDETRKHRRGGRSSGDCDCGGTGSIAGHDCGCGRQENHHEAIAERYEECRSRCARHEQEQEQEQEQYQRGECEQKCRSEFEKQRRERGGRRGRGRESEEERERGRRNPYLFEAERFKSKMRTEAGQIKILERFSKKSELLRGIDDYRVTMLEADPNTFALPNHFDADTVIFVVGGKATVSLVYKNERQSFELNEGDLIRVPSGAIVYLVNTDDNQKLYALNILKPVNTPGKFKAFSGGGGGNPESYYKVFSDEILEAAFNARRDEVEKILGQEGQGAIIKVSKQQIQQLTKESKASSSSSNGKSKEKWSQVISLKNQTPLFSNQYGNYSEASPNDHDQLKDLDLSVGFMTIKKGGMIEPYYNTRSTKVAFVVGGAGYFEMACPHLAEGEGEREREREGEQQYYAKVRAHLSVGDAFVVPAGHPVTMVASGESDLQLASFGINGGFNQKHFLVGKNNVWEEVAKQAKALAFGTAPEEVEELFKKQDESYFVAGPEQRETGRKHGGAVAASILEFAGF